MSGPVRNCRSSFNRRRKRGWTMPMWCCAFPEFLDGDRIIASGVMTMERDGDLYSYPPFGGLGHWRLGCQTPAALAGHRVTARLLINGSIPFATVDCAAGLTPPQGEVKAFGPGTIQPGRIYVRVSFLVDGSPVRGALPAAVLVWGAVGKTETTGQPSAAATG
jgi:hypothetical protein